jgi:hypothetical protein
VPEPRTLASPATEKQEAFVAGLLDTRDVPKKLRKKVRKARPLTDGDCRRFIPLLQACPYLYDDHTGPAVWPDEDWGNHEDWRDHPDAVFGDPYA